VLARKRVDHAVEIMAKLLPSWPTAHLLVIGRIEREPQYTEMIRNLIRERGLSGHVHLLGLRRDVPQLLKAGDVFLHTAERDPHPRAVLEAMAAELPVVAFSVDGVAETVVDGVSGKLVPFGEVAQAANAIDALLRDTDRRLRMGRQGRRRIEESFTAERTASGVAAVIAELLAGSGKPAHHEPINAAVF
jgi:glycosyltransferase involved in cell wall biosynthesis